MARKIMAGDSKLLSRTARESLRPSRKPCYRLIERGISLGYRKPKKGPGAWVVRRYIGNDSYTVRNLTTADGYPVFADDHEDANGKTVLSFAQAQDAARAHKNQLTGNAGPYTVNRAMDDYLDYLRSEGRSDAAIKDAAYRIEAFIRPTLGKFEVAALKPDQLRRWRADLAKDAPRLRTKSEDKQRHRKATDDRARKATANRILTTLKAALNHAFDEERVTSNKAWGRRVKPFEDVETARIRYLQIDEAKRLINAADPDFRPMMQAALFTGARYSELTRLTLADFDPNAGTVFIELSKGGKARHVVLSDEGVKFFRQSCAGRAGNELIFRKHNGSAWLKSHQARPMAAACKRAKIAPAIGFHGLRHTYATLAVKNGAPLHVIAKNLGHVTKDGQADTRMVTRHYAHFEASFEAAMIREHAPKFGFKPDRKIATLAGRA